MYQRILRGMGAVVAAGIVIILTGCETPVFELQVVNAGDYPLTSVRLVPVHEDSAEQAQAFEEAENLLPRDAGHNTMALASGTTVTLPHPVEADIYYVAVTFFVHGDYDEYIEPVPVDFTGLPDGALVVMKTRRLRPDFKTEPEVDIEFFYY